MIAALAVIPNGDPADWDHWNKVGMAAWVASGGSVHGFNAWCAWSSKHPQYDMAACRERWRHYPTSPPNQTGAGKLFRMAADAWPGWKRPSEGYTKDQGGPDPVWCDTDNWIEADIQKRPWIAPGRLMRGSVTLLTGPPSGMKSSLVLAWGSALALGINLGRFHPVDAGVTIVYNVEDDALEQRRRLSAALRQFPGATPADIRGKVIRTGPAGVGTLLVLDDAGRVHFTPAMARLEQLIIQHNVDVLFVDPLAELHNAEENANGAMRAIVARFRELAVKHNIAVVILHHTRKGGAGSAGDLDIARGASAIIGAVRVALTLCGMSEDDAKAFGLSTDVQARSHYVRLDDAKQNYAAVLDAEWFEKVPHHLDNGEIVPAAEPWGPPPQKQASPTEMVSLAAAIARGTPDLAPYSPKLSKEPRSVRHLLENYGFFGDAQKPAMDRLRAEFGVTTAHYRQSGRRSSDALGLHIAFKPAAAWVGQEPADTPTSGQSSGQTLDDDQ